MKQIELTYEIQAPLAAVWQAFVDPEQIDRWGGGPAEMDAKVGTAFSLWGGEIHGTNTAVEVEKKLVQDWYSGKEWSAPSHVAFSFESKGEGSIVRLLHTDVPSSEVDDITQGWEEFYLGPIQEYLED